MKVMMIRTKPLIKEYLDGIKAYLKDITNNLKISYTWKIQLAIAINFISSKNIVEERVIYSKRDNIEMMNYEKVDKVILPFNDFGRSILTMGEVARVGFKRGTSECKTSAWLLMILFMRFVLVGFKKMSSV